MPHLCIDVGRSFLLSTAVLTSPPSSVHLYLQYSRISPDAIALADDTGTNIARLTNVSNA